ERCRVILVTVPETTPVNEVIETAGTIVDRVGVELGPVVVDQVDTSPPLPDPATVSFARAKRYVDDARAAAEFRRARRRVQDSELGRLTRTLPLRQIHVRALPTAGLTADDVALLAAELAGDPD